MWYLWFAIFWMHCCYVVLLTHCKLIIGWHCGVTWQVYLCMPSSYQLAVEIEMEAVVLSRWIWSQSFCTHPVWCFQCDNVICWQRALVCMMHELHWGCCLATLKHGWPDPSWSGRTCAKPVYVFSSVLTTRVFYVHSMWNDSMLLTVLLADAR